MQTRLGDASAAFLGAACAVAVSAPLMLAKRPGTPLRALCIATMDYLAGRRDERLAPDRRRALAAGLDLGALVNDHFDGDRLDVPRYRALRREVGRSPVDRVAYRSYVSRLARLERGRPRLDVEASPVAAVAGDPASDVAAYRRAVLAVSLDFVFELAQGRSPVVPQPVRASILGLLDLLQLVDDLLDWPSDEAAGLPSYVTGVTRPGTEPVP